MSSVIRLMYIDPGSGSLFFQMILSALLTGLVFFKKVKLYIKHIFLGKRPNNTDDSSKKENL